MKAKVIGFEDVMLLPPKPGTCPECAAEHDKAMPHNRDSLYYQMRFRQKNGRFPTWGDAMAHCSEIVKGYWRSELAARGVKPEELEAGG